MGGVGMLTLAPMGPGAMCTTISWPASNSLYPTETAVWRKGWTASWEVLCVFVY